MRRLAAPVLIVIAAINWNGVTVASEVRPILVAQSPWIKSCRKDGDNKATCITHNEARKEAHDSLVASVSIVEPEGGKKELRVTFRLGVQLVWGTRLIIDRETPLRSSYLSCTTTSGCVSDYDAGDKLIDSMKSGMNLFIQAVDQNGAPLTVQLPLTNFAEAYDGPPMDPVRARRLHRPKPWLDDGPKPKPWLDDSLQRNLRPRAI